MADNAAKEVKGCQWVKKREFFVGKKKFNINFAFSAIAIFDFSTRNALKSRIVKQKPDLYKKISLLSGLLTYYESM